MPSARPTPSVRATEAPVSSRRAPTSQAARPPCQDQGCSAAGYIPAYDGGFYCPRCFHRRSALWRQQNRGRWALRVWCGPDAGLPDVCPLSHEEQPPRLAPPDAPLVRPAGQGGVHLPHDVSRALIDLHSYPHT